jgi:3-oxoacyl-[acyl-carrier-protein] synthase-3
MNGIHLMDALIATGQARRGLVVSGEQGSRYAQKAIKAMHATRRRADFMRLVGGLTLGDAGAAAVMGPKLDPDSGFMGFMLQSQGRHSKLCTCGTRGQESALETDMTAIVDEGIGMLAAMYDTFMERLGWKPEEISKFVHHQVGLRVFGKHARYAKISSKIMPNTVTEFGNLVTANIPVVLHKLQENHGVINGSRVFISGAGSGLAISQTGLIWDAA